MSEDHSARIGAIHRELHSHLPSAPELRVKALESLLVEKGLLDPNTVDAWIDAGDGPAQPLYTVSFLAADLWPEAAGRKDHVYLDLWESYLEHP